jgi:cold shock CspA family protein
MSSLKDSVTSTTTDERLTGRVKWFNNKAGYGFITVTDGSHSGSDIFIHHSAIQVENQQYKYLVQGEYVEFNLSDTPSGNHEFQAANVSGIKSGKLMCETRHEFKVSRSNYKTVSATTGTDDVEENVEVENPIVVKQKSAPRARGEGPRDGDKKDWTLVKKTEKAPSRPRGRPPRSNLEAK